MEYQEKRGKMEQKAELFSSQKLKEMIVPLFFEQLLVMLVGMADTLVVSYAGEAAVSGVSLVNQFNTIFIYLFTALASGGAVESASTLAGAQRTPQALLPASFCCSPLFFQPLCRDWYWREMTESCG